jgi:recombinational DNA repair protein RecR
MDTEIYNKKNKKDIMTLIEFSIIKGDYRLLKDLLETLSKMKYSSSEIEKIRNYLDDLDDIEIEIESDQEDTEHDHEKNIDQIIKNIRALLSEFLNYVHNIEKDYYKKWKRKIIKIDNN